MSIVRKEGKDTIIFATKEDYATPSGIVLPEAEPRPGAILPNGDINWNCPCLGGMATGPCGIEFRDCFSCLHFSTAEPKGSDCYDKFKVMQDCMEKYPTLYKKNDGFEDDYDEEAEHREKRHTSDRRYESKDHSEIKDQASEKKEG